MLNILSKANYMTSFPR